MSINIARDIFRSMDSNKTENKITVLKTQADIARYLGLARMTVQKALAGHPSVKEDTRILVLETARKYGYRPNRAALSMRSGVFKTVTVVGSTERGISHIPHGILQGIHNRSTKDELKVLLGEGFYLDEDNGAIEPAALKELITDGLLIHYYIDITDEIRTQVEKYCLPYVWLNSMDRFNAVRPDDFQAGKDACQRFLELGHKRLAYVSYHGDRHYSIKERYLGAVKAFENTEIESFQTQFTDSYTEGTCLDDAYALLSSDNHPTAVICYETQEAIAVYNAALALGLRIPEDLSVVVFHEEAARTVMGQKLSTYLVPFVEVGEYALDMLIKRIATGESFTSVKIPFEFLDDGSVKGYRESKSESCLRAYSSAQG